MFECKLNVCKIFKILNANILLKHSWSQSFNYIKRKGSLKKTVLSVDAKKGMEQVAGIQGNALLRLCIAFDA